eukprot:GDKI01044750.1.p1 GENE.GDKI01044750.1~~GDKI01044750.1.p1  ORF type:complete len:270 (-),score=60.95 GDKI01044750.1:283-1092(-)
MRVLAVALSLVLFASSTNANGCTADKETVFHPDFVKMVRSCGRWNLGSDVKTKACLLNETYGGKTVSETCATCYANSVKCGATNCRGACFLGDCTSMCQECINGESNCSAELKACTGLDKLPPACDDQDPKLSSKQLTEAKELYGDEATRAGCSSQGDVKTIWQSDFVESVRSCGRSNWGAYDGSLACLEGKTYGSEKLTVSHTCAQCYAESIKCGASNCMGSCMWGDCTKGCLACIAEYCTPQLLSCAQVDKLPPACNDKLQGKFMSQ